MISKQDLINWKLNDNINPLTGRKIKNTGKIYKKLSVAYYKNFKLELQNLVDHVDLISQDRLIVVDKKGNKKWVYPDLDKIIFYQEDNNIRAFTKFTISYLKRNNITEHPISKKKIPDHIFNFVENIPLENENSQNLKNDCKIFFQKLSNHSIFINYENFLKLEVEQLEKLAYELREFYYQNLSLEQRKIIDKIDGEQLFKNKPSDEQSLKKYLVNNMNSILDNIDKEMKIFSYYIIVGALSLVLNDVKEDYPDYSFSF